jgi:hypothetical protein
VIEATSLLAGGVLLIYKKTETERFRFMKLGIAHGNHADDQPAPCGGF